LQHAIKMAQEADKERFEKSKKVEEKWEAPQ
jgi:hypothetical protein